MSAGEPTVFDTFTYTGRCGHVCQVVNGREQPHECRPRPPRGRVSASVLREAAALMRERAEAVASGGQWTGGHYWITDYDPCDPSGQTAMQRLIGGMDEPDASHYSSWHPAVALAVADWLEGVAAWDDEGLGDTANLNRTNWPSMWGDMQVSALAIATAYLDP